jgi:hypothetical protein
VTQQFNTATRKDCQTETAAAIPAERPRGDGLRWRTWALKPGHSGAFREIPEETAKDRDELAEGEEL